MPTADTRTPEVAATPCPRCAKPLTDAAGLGWCPACGYCRSLEETAAQAPRLEPQPMPTGDAALMGPPREREEYRLPLWIFPLFLGAAGILYLSFFMERRLAPDALQRAIWTSVQIAAGILVVLVGQFAALMHLAHSDEKLGFKDVLLPLRLYGLVFSRLPKTLPSVFTLTWGLAAIAGALVFVGGLGHWFSYVSKDRNRNPPVIVPRP